MTHNPTVDVLCTTVHPAGQRRQEERGDVGHLLRVQEALQQRGGLVLFKVRRYGFVKVVDAVRFAKVGHISTYAASHGRAGEDAVDSDVGAFCHLGETASQCDL